MRTEKYLIQEFIPRKQKYVIKEKEEEEETKENNNFII